MTSDIIHQRQIQEQQKKIDSSFVEKQKMVFYGADHGYYELTKDAEKIEYIDRLTDELFENIAVRYHIQEGETEIKKILRAYIKDKEIL